MLLLAYPVFFVSGMAGLVYEIIWVRMLTSVFGTGIYAVTVVLAAFMAGLALGAISLGRVGDRLRNPLFTYAVIEVFIAAAGYALYFVLTQLGAIDAVIHSFCGQSFAVLTAFRFLASLVLLLIPTTLMGATLPIMCRALTRSDDRIGVHISELYAVNTAGAVLGAILAGFVLIGNLGVMLTSNFAVALNVVAAIGGLALSRYVEHKGSPVDDEIADESLSLTTPGGVRSPSSKSVQDGRVFRLVLLSAFGAGLASLGAQVLWTRSLIFVLVGLKQDTYSFSAMLAVFLMGLALGSGVIGMVADRLRTPLRAYGVLLCLSAVAIAFSAVLLGVARIPITTVDIIDIEKDSLRLPFYSVYVMAQTAVVIGLPTLLMGATLPLGIKSVVSVRRIGEQVGWVYGFNTAGAIIGPIIACFLLIPLLGLRGGLVLLAAIDLLFGITVIGYAGASRFLRWSLGIALSAVFLSIAVWLSQLGDLHDPGDGEKLIYYREDSVATVSVTEYQAGRKIFVDSVPVAGTSVIMQTDQKSLAHWPMALVRDPRKVLTVGFGSGGASYSYLLHDCLEEVHCVEICPGVVRASSYLKDANHGILEKRDPRYRIVFDDARAYLRYTKECYDIITTDCTDLRYKSSASLYDLEYFQFCRERLRSGGVVVVWMPLGGLSDEMFRLTLRTFYRVFPEFAVFYPHNFLPIHYVLLVGWKDQMEMDFQRFVEIVAESDVRADLAEICYDDPYKLLASFVTGEDKLKAYLKGDNVNTQNFPILEFEGPKRGFIQGESAFGNLHQLLERRVSAAPWIIPSTMSDAQSDRYSKYERASEMTLRGQFHEYASEVESACRAYVQAADLTPDDRALKKLLEFDWLAKLGRDGDAMAGGLLGRCRQLQNKFHEALELFDRAENVFASSSLHDPQLVAGFQDKLRLWREEIAAELKNGQQKQGSF